MTTDILCIILIIALLVIGWIWADKDDDFPSFRPLIMWLLSIIGLSICGAIIWEW